jgi:soluble lytic murein transglycosylase-like protein
MTGMQDLPGPYRGGRPTTTSPPSPLRTAALPGYFIWIPALLLITLAIGLHRFLNALLPSWETILQTQVMVDHQHLSANSAASSMGSAGYTHLSSTFTPEIQYWRDEILDWSQEFSLDPNLIAVVIQIESCGHSTIRSNAGALGLFQVMPFHFSQEEDPLELQTNASRGLAYLTRSLELSENQMDLTLAGYNGGHGLIHRNPSTWPEETKRYVKWGTGILEDIHRGGDTSATLNAWLAAGGARLCQEASLTQRE